MHLQPGMLTSKRRCLAAVLSSVLLGAQGAKWDGARIDADAAIDVFGADEAYPMSQVSPVHSFPSLAGSLTSASCAVAKPLMFYACRWRRGCPQLCQARIGSCTTLTEVVCFTWQWPH